MLIMSFHFFQHEISGILKNKEISSNDLYRICFKSHILFGIIAIFSGPTQFLSKLRASRLNLHKRLGYLYFCSAIISSVMGFVVARYAMGGLITTIGFSLLAIFWFISAIVAIRFIKLKQIDKHKKWMSINYGLTFAAITQRTLLLVPLLTGIEFILIYRLSAWLPWIFNTTIALYLFRKSRES